MRILYTMIFFFLFMTGCSLSSPKDKEMESLECKFNSKDCNCNLILKMHPKRFGDTSFIDFEQKN